MEKIEPGKYVEMVYDLSVVTPDGEELVHKVEPDSPERIVFGVTKGVIVPLEKAIEGLKKGDAFDVKVSAAEGFGPHDPEQVAHLDKSIFEVEGKFDDVRISKPGLRVYAGKDELPKVLGGLGIAIISTNQGVITDKKARELQVGGEVLAFVW